jgi:hypothetical protein
LAILLAGCAGPLPTLSLPAAAAPTAIPDGSPTPSALRPFVPTATVAPTLTTWPTPTPLPSATPTQPPPATPTTAPTVTTAPPTQPPPTLTAEPLPPAADGSTLINGIPFASIAVMPPEVAENVRAIAARGRELGRDPHAFSKLGDSLVLTDHYLTRFDSGGYNLGPFAALQPAIDQYAGSFGRYGVATKVGLYADFATRPGLANGTWCDAEEHMLACEFRLHNPSVLLIRVGTNDVIAASAFETALHKIVEYAIANGVVPVLGTKADRFEGDNRNNDIIRKVATDYRIPLWDFDLLAGTLPGRGLSGDNAHLSVYRHNDYTDPVTLQTGYPISDLSALVVLDALRVLIADSSAAP